MADQPLAGGYRLGELTHTFADGRLTAVSFTAPAYAFASAVAELRSTHGDPETIRRDRVKLAGGLVRPRVRMAWRVDGGAIVLTDPIGRGGGLAVRMAVYEGAEADAAS